MHPIAVAVLRPFHTLTTASSSECLDVRANKQEYSGIADWMACACHAADAIGVVDVAHMDLAEVVSAISRRFAGQVDDDIVTDIARSVVAGKCTLEAAMRQVAEMHGLPFSDIPSDDPLVDEALGRSDVMLSTMQRRLTLLRILRNLWYEDVRKAVEKAQSFVAEGANDVAVAVDMLDCLGRHQRVKERVELQHLASVLQLIHTTLQRCPATCSEQLVCCVKAARAMHSRFRHRIQGLLTKGGAPDAQAQCTASLEQFQIIGFAAQQYSHMSNELGREAEKLQTEVLGSLH